MFDQNDKAQIQVGEGLLLTLPIFPGLMLTARSSSSFFPGILENVD